MMLRALTLWRPWTDAIVFGPKRIENRGWVPPARVIGERIALHAGRRYDSPNPSWERGDWPWPDGYEPPLDAESAEGIVGTARIVGALDLRAGSHLARRRIWKPRDPRALTAEQARRLEELDRDPWWAGPVGWLLDDIVAIPAVPCRGAQGLWPVPETVARRVELRLDAVRMGAVDARPRRARIAERVLELGELPAERVLELAVRMGFRHRVEVETVAAREVAQEMAAEQARLVEMERAA